MKMSIEKALEVETEDQRFIRHSKRRSINNSVSSKRSGVQYEDGEGEEEIINTKELGVKKRRSFFNPSIVENRREQERGKRRQSISKLSKHSASRVSRRATPDNNSRTKNEGEYETLR